MMSHLVRSSAPANNSSSASVGGNDTTTLNVSRSLSSSSTLASEALPSDASISQSESGSTTNVTAKTGKEATTESEQQNNDANKKATEGDKPNVPSATNSKNTSATSVTSETKRFRFNERVLVGETWPATEYDRRGDTIVRLTPALAQAIRMELNEYKSKEMVVHEESRIYTHLLA
jgi:hypothetical protein